MDAEAAGTVTPAVVIVVATSIAGVWSQAHDPEIRRDEAAAREKERLDPVPRSDLEHLLQRQMTIWADVSDSSGGPSDVSGTPLGAIRHGVPVEVGTNRSDQQAGG